MTQEASKLKRRGFLRSAARWTVALGATLGGFVLLKRNGGSMTEPVCRDTEGRTGCAACGLLASCGLPRGLSFKRVRKEVGHD